MYKCNSLRMSNFDLILDRFEFIKYDIMHLHNITIFKHYLNTLSLKVVIFNITHIYYLFVYILYINYLKCKHL